MRLMLGGINGEYLRYITDNHAADTEEVLAAVAYANDASLLFQWCWDNRIPLEYYGRLDEGLAVSISILDTFLARRSPTFVCRLVQHHHAKVIWWRGVGVYIGSANLTGSAWYSNVEAGCFFPEDEITDDMARDLLDLFQTLKSNATPLTDELMAAMRHRARHLEQAQVDAGAFWSSPSFKRWSGLVQTSRSRAYDQRKQAFLEEWHATLQELRNIGSIVGRPENTPRWVGTAAPVGAQADQFLHAHYYQRTFEGRKANYLQYFEENRNNREAALADAIAWWRSLPKAPTTEDVMLNETAPQLREALSREALRSLTYDQFNEICLGVHAIKDYARRVSNKSVGLPEDGTKYTIPQKVRALSRRIWTDQNSDGSRIRRMLEFLLYGGPDPQLPERLWQCTTDPAWKLDGLGVSALGELVGWARPDEFPPRNGRTSKALKSLGYDVVIHVS